MRDRRWSIECGWGALLLEAVLPACSMRVAEGLRGLPGWVLGWVGGSAGAGQVQVRVGEAVAGGSAGLRLPAWVLVGAAMVYGLSVAYFAGRLGWGLWRTRGMRLRGESTYLSDGGAVGRMGHPEKAPRFAVRASGEVAGPVTVGFWRGVVLLPRGYLERVAAEDLQVVLAHEGAHVRRRDFLKNAVYGFVTLPVAFHPALWGTRRRMAESREMVCDAAAAEAVAGRERYAGSLLRLASLQVAGTPERMLHAIGIFGFYGSADANSFERRVMNLTEKRVTMTSARRAVMAVVCAVMGLGTCATAVALRVGVPVGQQSASEPGAPGQGARGPARVSGGVMAGQVLSKVNPTYPVDAKQEGISGTVVLHAIIGKEGAVENLQVVSGPEKLRTSALDAVRQWTYKPYVLNGQPVEVDTTITVTYSLAP